MKLSKNFELSEFLISQTATRKGISNEPTEEHVKNLQSLVTNLLQPLRDRWSRPISVSSGYRGEKLNLAVGGSITSQHCKGEAVDFMFSGMTALEGCKFIIESGLEFDQLIYEGDWIHLSYSQGKNRMQVLTAVFEPGKRTRYIVGLPK